MNQKQTFYFQRKFKRRAIEVPVGTICRDLGYFEQALELSEGGILVRSEFQYKVGDKAELCFFIPDGEFVSMIGEVLYVINGGATTRLAGLRFAGATEGSLSAIRHYVNRDAKELRVARFIKKPISKQLYT